MAEKKEKSKNPPEAHGPGAPLSNDTTKGVYTESDSYRDFLWMMG